MKLEAKIQQACVMWYRNEFCKSEHQRKWLIEINNNPKNEIDGSRRIAMGMVRGASDMIFLKSFILKSDSGRYTYPKGFACIEFKSERGTQNQHQVQFQRSIEIGGGFYIVIHSVEEFKDFFLNQIEYD